MSEQQEARTYASRVAEATLDLHGPDAAPAARMARPRRRAFDFEAEAKRAMAQYPTVRAQLAR